MQVALDRTDRKLLIGGILLMLLMVGATAMIAPQTPTQAPSASSYSPATDGAKAAYLLLGEMGYQTERWTQPLSELPQSGAGLVLVLADRNRGIQVGDVDGERLANFLRSGGRLIYTGSYVSDLFDKSSSELMDV